MAERATRQLLDGIAAFRDAYKDDPKFKDLISELDKSEETAEKLVPGAYDRTPDEADRISLKDAGTRARQQLRDAKRATKSDDDGDEPSDSKQ